MADSYEFLKGHYDRIQSEQRARDKECGEDHIVGERPDDCFACLSEQRDELLAALKAARDLLVGCQKQAGQIPGQGYSATLTEHEMVLAKGIESVGVIIARAEGKP